MTDEKCDQCQETGRLGPEIRAYRFTTAKGKSVVRYLHASDGGKPCYYQYDERYKKWLAEERAKAVSNG